MVMTSTTDGFTGDDVLRLRTRLGITQAELAERLGVSAKSVGNWERGGSIRRASVEAMRMMVDALDGAVAQDSPERRLSDLEARMDYLERLVLKMRADDLDDADELARRRADTGLSVPPRNLRAVADSNRDADAEGEANQEEP